VLGSAPNDPVSGSAQGGCRRSANRIVSKAQLRISGHVTLDGLSIVGEMPIGVGKQALDLLSIGVKPFEPLIDGPIL
jgi:hypothetical protein